jgi:hypothetical protein|tara:strand:+ start:406 stop:729 length:324 start_codon:yes stop_codon:yes gene_type:complete
MKVGIVVIAAIMTMTGPVFADQSEEPGYVIYKIKIDRDEEYDKMLEENKEIFEQLKNHNLFSNWKNDGDRIPSNASEAYKKPSFDDSAETNKEETDYIKCVRGTTTK